MKKAKLRTLAAGLAATVAMTCLSGITAGAAAQSVGEAAQAVMPTRTQALEALERANDYWITNHTTHGRAFWDNAAYHVGNMEAYFTTGIEAYRNYSENWAVKNSWKGATSDNKSAWKGGASTGGYGEGMEYVLFGDWQICFQTYIDLYNIEVMESKGATKDEGKVSRAKEVMEYQMSRSEKDWWWWADSLFMAMPIMSKMYVLTGNQKYLDKQYEWFVYAAEEVEGGTKDGMWDEEYKLFHRDGKYIYPDHKTDNGKKDFWARGSGWVFAGLARVLSDMPTDYEHRDYFLDKYTQMAEGVKNTQQIEGFWSRSMADRAHADGFETSGTAFFTYGLAWGINSGYLDSATYLETCLKGWYFLYNTSLQSDGCLGYVQPIGENAKQSLNVGARDTQNFGVGAFLLAASEISKLAGGVYGDQTNNGDVYPYLMRKMVSNYAVEIASPHFYVEGMINHMDNSNHNQKLYTKDGTAMIPVRVVQAYMGGTVTEAGDTVTASRSVTNGSTYTVVFTKGSTSYTVNGVIKTASAAAETSDLGYTCVPLRALMEGLGYHIWYSAYSGLSTYTTDALGDLIVISEKADPFFGCDSNAVEMLRWMIGPSEHYPTRPSQTDRGYTVEPAQSAPSKPIGTQLTLNASMVSASATPESQNNAAQTVDNNVSTRYAAQGSQYLQIDLGSAKQIACVGVRMMQYSDGRTVNYGVSYSADGTSYTSAFSGSSVVNGGTWEFPRLNGATARYIRINLNGSTTNDWASLADVAVFEGDENSAETTISGATGTTSGTTVTSVTGSTASGSKVTLTAAMLSAPTDEAANPPANAVDGNASTFWAASKGHEMVIDLGSSAVVSTVGVQMRKYDDSRTVNYGVAVSADGSSYSQIFSGACAAGGGTMEYVSVGANARYVKIITNGNSVSDWASVAEVEVYTGGTATVTLSGTTGTTSGTTVTSTTGSTASGSKVTLTAAMLTAPTDEAANPPANAVDGNASTFWAASKGHEMVIDLGSSAVVSTVGVQMRKYDDSRTVNYGVAVSADGSSYSQIFSGACAAGGGTMEYVSVGANARYVKIITNGNSVSDWASVAEVEVYTGGTATAVTTVTTTSTPTTINSTQSNTSTGTKINVTSSMVKFSSEPESANPGSNSLDGNAGTVWATQGTQNAVIDLGSAMNIACVGVQMKQYDDGRTVNYSIEVSGDGSSYTSVFSGACAANGGVMEYHTVGAGARYVRIGTNGSTTNDWASVAEIEVYSGAGAAAAVTTSSVASVSSKPVGTKEALKTAGSAILIDEKYPASAAIDNNTSTYWKGNANHSLVVEITKDIRTITSIGVRAADDVGITLSVSADGSAWTTVYTGNAVGGTEAYYTCQAKGKYVMVTLASEGKIAEVEVYGAE